MCGKICGSEETAVAISIGALLAGSPLLSQAPLSHLCEAEFVECREPLELENGLRDETELDLSAYASAQHGYANGAHLIEDRVADSPMGTNARSPSESFRDARHSQRENLYGVESIYPNDLYRNRVYVPKPVVLQENVQENVPEESGIGNAPTEFHDRHSWVSDPDYGVGYIPMDQEFQIQRNHSQLPGGRISRTSRMSGTMETAGIMQQRPAMQLPVQTTATSDRYPRLAANNATAPPGMEKISFFVKKSDKKDQNLASIMQSMFLDAAPPKQETKQDVKKVEKKSFGLFGRKKKKDKTSAPTQSSSPPETVSSASSASSRVPLSPNIQGLRLPAIPPSEIPCRTSRLPANSLSFYGGTADLHTVVSSPTHSGEYAPMGSPQSPGPGRPHQQSISVLSRQTPNRSTYRLARATFTEDDECGYSRSVRIPSAAGHSPNSSHFVLRSPNVQQFSSSYSERSQRLLDDGYIAPVTRQHRSAPVQYSNSPEALDAFYREMAMQSQSVAPCRPESRPYSPRADLYSLSPNSHSYCADPHQQPRRDSQSPRHHSKSPRSHSPRNYSPDRQSHNQQAVDSGHRRTSSRHRSHHHSSQHGSGGSNRGSPNHDSKNGRSSPVDSRVSDRRGGSTRRDHSTHRGSKQYQRDESPRRHSTRSCSPRHARSERQSRQHFADDRSYR